ncbi:MAG: glycosyltransferase involved in cell wall biosynthesis [Verrucomicrobiales bacterium]|jgi:glycosyltransferase involved in cell wall biosynthesis
MLPHLQFIGSVGIEAKNQLFARASALLHLNTIPERFGLVLAEANAAGYSNRQQVESLGFPENEIYSQG